MKKKACEFLRKMENSFGIIKEDFNDIFFDEKLRQIIYGNEEIIKSDIHILLKGETGTGKSFLAVIIHRLSNRRKNKFDRIDCSKYEMNESLFRSDLFGHERGAYTDAKETKAGLLESLDKGTLCLENIEDLPFKIQNQLRIFLEDGTFKRTGGITTKYSNVRIIGTYVRDLEEMIMNNEFSNQLFNRLNNKIFRISPLRERKDAIPFFIEHFIKNSCISRKKNIKEISEQFIKFALAFSWSEGNLRTLKKTIDTAVIGAKDNKISLSLILDTFENKKWAIEEIWKLYGKAFDSLNEEQKKILFDNKFESIIDNPFIQEKFDVSRDTANRWLSEMKKKGFLKKLKILGRHGAYQFKILYPYLP